MHLFNVTMSPAPVSSRQGLKSQAGCNVCKLFEAYLWFFSSNSTPMDTLAIRYPYEAALYRESSSFGWLAGAPINLQLQGEIMS